MADVLAQLAEGWPRVYEWASAMVDKRELREPPRARPEPE